jgi:hypothetical protein
MPDETIDEIIDVLSGIVERERERGGRLGYFPAVYRKVTREIARRIEAGEFEDGPRMEALDVRFALRYVDAYEAFQRGEPTTRSWDVCLRAADDERPIVLQHLLLAMNAHINLDLGIAAARTSPGDGLPSLRSDFERINRVLSDMVDEVERELADVWPLLRPLDWLAGRLDERVVGFSMGQARDHAWRFALALGPEDEVRQAELIDFVDLWIGAFGEQVWRPSWPLAWVQRIVRMGERGGVAAIIDRLS